MAAEDHYGDALDNDHFSDFQQWFDDGCPKTAECRSCGKGNLFWENDNGRWRLVDVRGQIHVCDQKAALRGVADDFDDVSMPPTVQRWLLWHAESDDLYECFNGDEREVDISVSHACDVTGIDKFERRFIADLLE